MQFFDATGAGRCAPCQAVLSEATWPPRVSDRRVLSEQNPSVVEIAMPVAKILIFRENGGRTRTRTLDPLIKSLFCHRMASR
jgi:hypothetical protein